MPVGKKFPTQNRSARGRWKSKRQSKVVGVELRASEGLHEPEKLGWSADDITKQHGNEMKNNNKMKNKNEWTTTTKWRIKMNNNKNLPGGSPKQSTIAGSFCCVDFRLKKNDYRSVISITFLSDIVFHLVAISILNKSNEWCWRYIKRWWIFGDIAHTPKEGTEYHKKRQCLKSVIDKGKLRHKWTHERVDKASDETINKNTNTSSVNWTKKVKKLERP